MAKKKRIVGKCIYCADNLNKELSDEHYLPRGLGKFQGFEMLKDRICVTHNNSFGDLEQQFLRSSEIAFFRHLLNIEGRSEHKKINSFHRGSSGGERLEMKGKFPGEDFEVLYELNRGNKTIQYMRQMIFFTENGIVHLPIPDDMKDPLQFKEKLKELGISHAKEVRIFAAESEEQWIDSLLSGVSIEEKGPLKKSPSEGKVQTIVKFSVTSKHFRAIAKIAFHYLLKHNNLFTGSEDCFANIRDFILNGGNVSSFVQMDNKQTIIQVLEGMELITYNHFLSAGANNKYLWGRLQFFLGPDFQPPVNVVNLGNDPRRIEYTISFAHQFEYYESGKIKGYDGLMEKARGISKTLLP